jgi:predicted transposase YdaD
MSNSGKDQAGLAARKILNSVSTEAEFQLKLDLVESILVNKFAQLTLEEIQKMLNLKEADVTQTQFYQEVLLDFQNMSDLENWLQDNRP